MRRDEFLYLMLEFPQDEVLELFKGDMLLDSTVIFDRNPNVTDAWEVFKDGVGGS